MSLKKLMNSSPSPQRSFAPTKAVPVNPEHVKALHTALKKLSKKFDKIRNRAKTRFRRHNFTA